MKFAIVVLACLIGAACAQYNRPEQYSPFGFAQRNQYNQYNQYNPYNRFNNNKPYNRYNSQFNQYSTPSPYRPFTTAAPVTAPVTTFSPISVTTPAPLVKVPALYAKALSDPRYASTLRYGNEINPDNSYNYFFETDNGIAAQEVGSPRNFGGNPPVAPIVAQGSFSWISPEGQTIAITYVADENGYQPQGDAIPTSPPIPAQIARALEYIARNAPKQ